VTDGVPTLASIVAVGVPNPAASPVSPLSPLGIVKFILYLGLPLVSIPSSVNDTLAAVPALPVVIVPILSYGV
jgi:hypothetical protein